MAGFLQSLSFVRWAGQRVFATKKQSLWTVKDKLDQGDVSTIVLERKQKGKCMEKQGGWEQVSREDTRRKFDSWVRKTPGEGNGNPLQYSCLGNPMDRGAWWAAVRGVVRSQI